MTTTTAPAARINDVATAQDRDTLAWADAGRTVGSTHYAVGAFQRAARTILTAVEFRDADSPAVQTLVRVLERIANLSADADIVNDHTVQHLVYGTASSARNGYSLPTSADRIAELLDAAELDRTTGDARYPLPLVGMLRVAFPYEHTTDHGTPWRSTYLVHAQDVPVYLIDDKVVAAALKATLTSRETGAQLGGVDIVRTTETVDEPATVSFQAYPHEAAERLATTGTLFGHPVILARGVELKAARYDYAGNDPRRLSWSITTTAAATTDEAGA